MSLCHYKGVLWGFELGLDIKTICKLGFYVRQAALVPQFLLSADPCVLPSLAVIVSTDERLTSA